MLSTKKIAGLGILASISILLAAAIHFPIFPAAVFLEYDPADIPIFLGTFMYGPVSGLILTGVVCVLQGLTVSVKSGVIGMLMHFTATGSYVLVAGLIYSRKKTIKSAVIAMSSGVLAWIVAMVCFNLLLTPVFMGTPREAVISMLLPVIVPFNLIKAGVNSLLTFLLYKKTHQLFKKYFHASKLSPRSFSEVKETKADERAKNKANEKIDIDIKKIEETNADTRSSEKITNLIDNKGTDGDSSKAKNVDDLDVDKK